MSLKRTLIALGVVVILAGCSQTGHRSGGGYYKDDGPMDDVPGNLSAVSQPVPRWEPVNRGSTRPYVIFGRTYTPFNSVRPFRQRGIASWYGKKFHGKSTAIGERYDMFGYSAAHPTLALPSYIRVTNLANGKQVVVRVNDRGPFHAGRIVDLSYLAAKQLGLVGKGSGEVEIEAIVPDGDVAEATEHTASAESLPASYSGVGERGVYVQLGAFSNPDNAENLRVHATRELEWLNEPVRVFSSEGLYRVRVGPFDSRTQADEVALRAGDDLGSKPTVVIR